MTLPKVFEPLRERAWRLFWIGAVISLTGDQLTFIALPWLVLKLTNDPLAMGLVTAVAAIPRALFMLLGGALTDRMSPRVVLLVSNFVRLCTVATLALLTATDAIEMWMIYTIAVVFGLADAFMFPAMNVMPPRLLERERLAAGNSLLQGSAQLTLVFGPLIAGALIATTAGVDAGSAERIEGRVGLALVFSITAITFIAPMVALSMIRERFPAGDAPGTSLVESLKAGMRYVWNDKPLRTFIILMGLLSLVFRGPFNIGLPAFANAWLPEGAAGFGTIVSALGVGAIIGTIVAGSTTLPSGRHLGVLLLADFAGFGAILVAMTFIHELWPIAALILIAGAFDGFVIIVMVTWIQQRVAPEYLGRSMSVMMFVNTGLFPISAAVAGAAASVDLAAMLLVSGVTMVVVAAGGVLSRSFRTLGHDS